jgi:hypothetical protein
MNRVLLASCFGLALLGCGTNDRAPVPDVDCSVDDDLEFRKISDFNGKDPNWFRYGDNTPGGVPDLQQGSDLTTKQLPPPGRCGDTQYLRLKASGHNFWGAGFGDWGHNPDTGRADGEGYEGISFWVRSEPNTETTFMLNVDDGRTIVLPPELPDCVSADGQADAGSAMDCPPPDALPVATDADQDLDGDGFVGPGDIARGTRCRLPPPQELGDAACYNGGINPPAAATRVPEPDECGNAFHVVIHTTTEWQFVRIPFQDLVQWPCPNRLDGGIDPADIAKFEVLFDQGTHYDVWIDNIAFYRKKR